MKLTPMQIGFLARCVERVLKQFPEPTIKVVEKEETGPQQWEIELEKMLKETLFYIPSYKEIEEKHSDVLEFLLGYYSSEVIARNPAYDGPDGIFTGL